MDQSSQLDHQRLKRKLYGGFSLFGVPYHEVDINYSSEALYDAYTLDGRTINDAMMLLLENNERVVSRCGMLISFSGTLIALLLFIANRPKMLPALWQQWVYYIVMFIWVFSTMRLLFSLRHKYPPPWEFHTKFDFMMTSELFLRRMGIYNIALITTIIAFFLIVFLLSPMSLIVTNKLFGSVPLS